MLTIPLQAIPNQTLQCQVNGQNCTITIQQYAYGLFFSLQVGTELIVSSVPCLNLVFLVRFAYLGFIGDFVFVDTQGTSNPIYTALGSRCQLVYLTPAEVAEYAAVAAAA
jgi:hypothetical protein